MLAAIVSNGNVEHIVTTYGYVAVFLFVAVESLGVPFPGETALIAAAGYAGATHHLVIPYVVLAAIGGAIIGDNVGFVIGHFGGFRLLLRYGRYVRIDEGKMKVARYIFAHHGGKVVFFGRFISILRTYAAFLAGTSRMPWRPFLAYNAAGGVVWACIYGIGSFYAGSGIERTSTPLDIAMGITGVLAIIAFTLFVRRRVGRLQHVADREFPGPLTAPRPRSPR